MSGAFDRWGETILGAVVAVVAVAFFGFAASQAGQTRSGGGYELHARFQNVGGIAVGSDVRVSGVKVGVVRAVTLDAATYDARITMVIDSAVVVPEDSTARIATDGLLGGAFIAIEPTGEAPLAAGGEIANTQPAVDFLTLLASFAQGQGQSNSEAMSP